MGTPARWARPRDGHARAPERAQSRSVRDVARGPLHDTDHHGDFIVIIDADLGVGVVWGAEGTQECDVLLKLGQGRATDKSPLFLACISVLRPHGHHLRSSERAASAPADRERVAEPYWLPQHAPCGGAWTGPKGPAKDLTPIRRGIQVPGKVSIQVPGRVGVWLMIAFPGGADGDEARAILPDAVKKSHDRLRTVGRTVATGTPITTKIEQCGAW
jgi:hypothetical protein